ncbi:protein translocase subunit SecD [Actinobaculum sp. 352]|uniref:protein translocase subunit SecD n=1 Tax=Actinobaculum sp. 352 TaxID=2490946 RepID=UPI000F7EA8B0|nr:protein translocase subunit SecD [Actinobaculum sp. 352]RTE48698.1 protein translocase subunit SecD [Actinobaculum sp. 352]
MASHRSERAAVTPWRRLILLIVLVIALLAALIVGTVTTHKSKWVPEFALDLEGGTQIILTPVTTDGSTVTQEDVNQAIEIIRQRIDASGVAEAEITSQGGQNIVVGIPGTPSQETLDLVRTSAVMRMRPVLQMVNPTDLRPDTVSQGSEGSDDAASQATVDGATSEATVDAETGTGEDTAVDGSDADAADDAAAQGSESDSTQAATSDATSGEATADATPSVQATYSAEELEEQAKALADTDGDGQLSDEPATTPENPSDPAWITEQVLYQSYLLDCTDPSAHVSAESDDPDKAMVACDHDTGAKYILGPAEIEGTELSRAASGFDTEKGSWVVNINFNSSGADTFTEVTTRLISLESPRDLFAITLDGNIITAARPEGVISGGNAQISGSGFTSESTTTLANQLNFGSLPLSFEVQSEEQISATLGSESLQAGLLAGLIGIVLIVIYLLWQYHGLGLVAIGSIALATGLSYLIVCLLSWTIGYRLSLAGVVGLIISIGITADSFIVFFERIRDEIRDGRSLRVAVHRGWHRAKRTIIVADSVNLVCALVLYFLAVGSVRGFAFTLGLTTILDLVIVTMFTYPVMMLLVRTKFFGQGRRFSGMDPVALGGEPLYRGAGSFSDRPRSRRRAQAEEATTAETGSARRKKKSDQAPLDAADAGTRRAQAGSSEPDRSTAGEEAATEEEDSAVEGSEGRAASETVDVAAQTAKAATSDEERQVNEEAAAEDPEMVGLSLAQRRALQRRRARETAAAVSNDGAITGGGTSADSKEENV